MNQVVKRPDSKALRDAIFRREAELAELPQVECRIDHHFAPGLYSREMYVPAGCMMTGAIHKFEHLSMFLEGRMLVPDEYGNTVEIVAPIVEVAKPGIKRIGYSLEDVRWITVHNTEETDLDTLWDLLVTNDPQEQQIIIDREDYKSLGVSDEVIEKLAAVEVFPGDEENLEIRPSDRHGMGLFVKGLIDAGETIGAGVKDGKLLEYSRYTNHSVECNAFAEKRGEDVYLVAARDIRDEEVTIDYRTTHPPGLEYEIDNVIKIYERNLKCHR
jgi:hypothetical protein